jgi:hypothetical protein
MAYQHLRANFTTTERDMVLALLDRKLEELSEDFGSDEFANFFRVRDRLARCKVYSQSVKKD